VYLKSVFTANVESAPVAAGPRGELTRVVLRLRLIVVATPRFGERATVDRRRMRFVKRDSWMGKSGELKVAVRVIVSPEKKREPV